MHTFHIMSLSAGLYCAQQNVVYITHKPVSILFFLQATCGGCGDIQCQTSQFQPTMYRLLVRNHCIILFWSASVPWHQISWASDWLSRYSYPAPNLPSGFKPCWKNRDRWTEKWRTWTHCKFPWLSLTVITFTGSAVAGCTVCHVKRISFLLRIGAVRPKFYGNGIIPAKMLKPFDK